MEFVESLVLIDGPDEVWKRVSDVEAIPKYWHGTSSIQITERKNSGVLSIVVGFAFGGKGRAEVSVDDQTRTLTIQYYSGPFTGVQEISVKEDRILASWDVKFTGFFKLLSKWNQSHFRAGTIHALERLNSGSSNS